MHTLSPPHTPTQTEKPDTSEADAASYIARLKLAQADPTAPVLTQDDASRRHSCSTMTIRRRMRDGSLPYFVVGTRHVRFALADLQRIEAASRVEIPQVH